MKTFAYSLSDGSTASYTDRKRYLWLLSVVFPLTPIISIAQFQAGAGNWVLWAPLIFLYLVLPLLDFLLGKDEQNPPEEVVPQLERDPYYRVLTYATVPLHFITLAAGAWFVGTQDLAVADYLAVCLTVGLISGLGINTGHEIGHKQTPLEQVLARIVLAVPAYGHFTVEHNAGHHTQVATPEDSASARFGESIYRFAMREIPGGIRRGWALESRRLERLGLGPWCPQNTILQSYLLSAVIFGSLLMTFGPVVLPFLLLQSVFAWWQLTSANYIEHYGLQRQRRPNGRYEPCQPHHSWNANHLLSNLLLFHLERHSDHHAHANRRYQSLRNFDNIPSLPTGYFGMFLLAYVPFLWRRVMDPRVLSQVQGDMNQVNLGLPSRAPSADQAPGSAHPEKSEIT